MHRQLAGGAREWEESNRDQSFLLRGGQLAQFDALADKPRIALTDLERDFVTASREAARQGLLRQQRENRRLRILLGAAGVLLAISVVAVIVALLQRSSAKHEATVALARELGAKAVVEPRLDRAMLLADEAVNLDRSRETEGTLLSTLLRSPAAISTFSSPITDRPQTVTLSPDGQTLVVVENTGLGRFYDTRTRRERRPPLANLVDLRAAFSNDGKYLLIPRRPSSANAPPAVDLLDGRTLEHLRFLPVDQRWLNGYESFAQVLLVSPDDARAYLLYSLIDPTTGIDLKTYVDIWSIRSGKRLRSAPIGTRGLFDARFDGSGKLVLLVDAGVVTLDARSLHRTSSRPLQLPVSSAVGIGALAPDGRTAGIAQHTGAVSFIDLASGRVTGAAGKTGAAVQAIAYSPTGRVADDGRERPRHRLGLQNCRGTRDVRRARRPRPRYRLRNRRADRLHMQPRRRNLRVGPRRQPPLRPPIRSSRSLGQELRHINVAAARDLGGRLGLRHTPATAPDRPLLARHAA